MELIVGSKDKKTPYVLSGKISETRIDERELLTGAPVSVDLEYWVADSTSNWNNTANWDTTSGGPGGASVPGTDTTVVFDPAGLGSCIIDISPQVAHMILDGYTGVFFGECTTTRLDLVSDYASAGSDTTIHALGDVSGSALYGAWTSGNNLPIEFNGPGTQKLTISSGCVLPVVITNKRVSQQVICHGDSPILVNGGFLIHDGTFNMNGRDIQVGI